MREICAMFKVCKSTIRNWINQGEFPEGELFSPRCRRWSEKELVAHAKSRRDINGMALALKAVEDRQRVAKAGGAAVPVFQNG